MKQRPVRCRQAIRPKANRTQQIEVPRVGELRLASNRTQACACVRTASKQPHPALRAMEVKTISRQKYVPPYLIAQPYACTGEKDLAFERLTRGFQGRDRPPHKIRSFHHRIPTARQSDDQLESPAGSRLIGDSLAFADTSSLYEVLQLIHTIAGNRNASRKDEAKRRGDRPFRSSTAMALAIESQGMAIALARNATA